MKPIIFLALTFIVLSLNARAEKFSNYEGKVGQADTFADLHTNSTLSLFERYYVLADPKVTEEMVSSSLIRAAPANFRNNLFGIRKIVRMTAIDLVRQQQLVHLNRAFQSEIVSMDSGFLSHFYWHSILEQTALTFVATGSTLKTDPATVLSFIKFTPLTDLIGVRDLVPTPLGPQATPNPTAAALQSSDHNLFQYNNYLMIFMQIN